MKKAAIYLFLILLPVLLWSALQVRWLTQQNITQGTIFNLTTHQGVRLDQADAQKLYKALNTPVLFGFTEQLPLISTEQQQLKHGYNLKIVFMSKTGSAVVYADIPQTTAGSGVVKAGMLARPASDNFLGLVTEISNSYHFDLTNRGLFATLPS